MTYMNSKLQTLFLTYSRSFSSSKTAIVIPQRNLTFERRNLYYKESFQKYKHYFEKPSFSFYYNTYIDYFHDIYLSKLFNTNVELDRIKLIKKSSRSDKFNFKIFLYDLYYDFFLNVELFFPYYDLYNIFAFLF